MSVKQDVETLVEDWAAERPDLDMGSLWISLPLRRSLQRAEASRARLLTRYGVTPTTLDLLVALRRQGPPYTATPSELARSLVLSAGGVSQRLDRMQQAGLIERSVNVDDRRVVHVHLTPAGLRTLDELIDEYMDHEEALLSQLTTRQRRDLSRLLVLLTGSVEAADVGD